MKETKNSENIIFVGNYKVKGIKNGTIKEVEEFLDSSASFCFDTETTGLDPHSSKIIMFQVGNPDIQYVIDARHISVKSLLKYLEDPEKVKIGANLAFDYKMVLSNYGVRIQNIFDTMVAEMIIECGKVKKGTVSLQGQSKKYLDINIVKDVRGEFTLIKDQPFNFRQIVYGGRDTIYPWLIKDCQEKVLKERNQKVCNKLEQNYTKAVAEMEYHGIPFDEAIWKNIDKQCRLQEVESKKALDAFILDNHVRGFLGALDMFTGKPRILIDWTSPKQVSKLFKQLGVPVEILDKKATDKAQDRYGLDIQIFKNSVGKEEIARYRKFYPIVDLFLNWKDNQTAISKFGYNSFYKKHINPITNRVHTNFWQIVRSGRSSSRNPNIQQIPSRKSKEFKWSEAHRSAIVAPEGKVLIVRDYSGQEARLIADMSDEDAMIYEFIHGSGDIHSVTASKIFSHIQGKHVPVSKKVNVHLRSLTKPVVFGSLYGIGAFKLAKNLKISEEEAQEILDAFYVAYPKLKSYFEKKHRQAVSDGYVLIDEFTGRRSYFNFYSKWRRLEKEKERFGELQYRARKEGLPKPTMPKKFWSEYFSLKGEMERKAQNFPY